MPHMYHSLLFSLEAASTAWEEWPSPFTPSQGWGTGRATPAPWGTPGNVTPTPWGTPGNVTRQCRRVKAQAWSTELRVLRGWGQSSAWGQGLAGPWFTCVWHEGTRVLEGTGHSGARPTPTLFCSCVDKKLVQGDGGIHTWILRLSPWIPKKWTGGVRPGVTQTGWCLSPMPLAALCVSGTKRQVGGLSLCCIRLRDPTLIHHVGPHYTITALTPSLTAVPTSQNLKQMITYI